MKKFLLVFLLAITLLPATTFALEPKDDVLSFVTSHQYTAEATCVIFGKYCVVGVRTKGILLKSDSQKYFESLKQGILQIDDNIRQVYITNDLQEVLLIKDVSKKMDDGMSNMQIFQYVKQKYPKVIDKILLSAHI